VHCWHRLNPWRPVAAGQLACLGGTTQRLGLALVDPGRLRVGSRCPVHATLGFGRGESSVLDTLSPRPGLCYPVLDVSGLTSVPWPRCSHVGALLRPFGPDLTSSQPSTTSVSRTVEIALPSTSKFTEPGVFQLNSWQP
jgi:hypothetical protein